MKIRLKVLAGSCAARKRPRPDGRYYIGTGDRCHFQVRDEHVSAEQCSLRVGQTRVTLETLSSAPTLVNGHVVSGRCELSDGDVLTIGNTRFCLLLIDHSPQEQDPLAGEVSEWLSEEDERERMLRQLDPTARRLELGQPSNGGSEEGTDPAVGDKPEDETPTPASKQPQKLPQRRTPLAASSHEAASDVLTKIFSRTPRDKRN